MAASGAPHRHTVVQRARLQLARRAPHSPRESVMQYGELVLAMAGQVSVPGPNTGLANESLLPGKSRSWLPFRIMSGARAANGCTW